MNSVNPQFERFHQLAAKIRLEVDRLKKKNETLVRENRQLKTELQKYRDRPVDTFSSLRDPERIALKNRIDRLIAKIDEHLRE